MQATLAAASTAAAIAGLSYLDAKFHLRQDWRWIRGRSKMAKLMEKSLREKRFSPYYMFEKRARLDPDAECIWVRQRSYTRADALHRAHQFADFFLRQHVQPGQLVALFMENSPDFIFAWLGLLAVGAAPALINHNLPNEALLHCLAISGAPLILADGKPELLARIDEVRDELASNGVQVVKLHEVRPELNASRGERPSNELRDGIVPTSPFGLFYTSGTTGLPKACIMPMAAGFSIGASRECGIGIVQGENERFYDCMPLYHGTGAMSGMAQILGGTTLCLAPKFSASRFWDDIRESRATWFAYVGETLRYLLAAPPSPRDKEHSVHGIYGNGLRPDVWKAFRDRFGIETIHEFFNSTEGVFALDNPCRGDFRAHAVGHHGLLLRNRYHDTFIPVEIDPDTGDIARDPKTGLARRVPYEVGGEIIVQPSSRHARPFGGYYGNKEATDKKFVRDVFKKGDTYYRTGDALRRDADGRWFFLDRLGDTFRWKGENVSTAEVSEVLGHYPGVLEATVYGVPLPGHDGKAGMVAVYLDPSVAQFDYNGLLKHARAHLPKYAVPIFIRKIKAPPATHNNKQNKAPLKADGIDPANMDGDPLLWISDNGKGSTYQPFTQADWDALNVGKAKL